MQKYSIELYQRPNSLISNEIIYLAKLLSDKWFTSNVPEDIRMDLLFQDAFCLYIGKELLSFLIFTSIDGSLQITLMGTHPNHQNKGLGSQLIISFIDHARKLGFKNIVVWTVPPDTKPAYKSTLSFYEKHGFVLLKRYNELWENGAVKLIKSLE